MMKNDKHMINWGAFKKFTVIFGKWFLLFIIVSHIKMGR